MRLAFPFICLTLLSQIAFAQSETPTPAPQTETPAEEAAAQLENKAAAPAVDKGARSEKVQVTGSRIKRIDVEGPKSITVIGSEDIERTGATTVNELLNSKSFASFGSAQYGSGYGGVAEAQSVNVRGLGSANTLILVNGKRVAKDPYLEFTDLSVIPTSAIERIEVLKGTASAVYGSDALGGVVNIITKKDLDGIGFGGKVVKPRQDGGTEEKAYYMVGTSSERSRNLTVLEYTKKDPIYIDQRNWNDIANNKSSFGVPASYATTDGGFKIVGGQSNCDDVLVSGANEYCRFEQLKGEVNLTPSVSKLSLFNDFSYNLNDSDTVSVRIFANQYDSLDKGTPTILDTRENQYYVNPTAVAAAQARGDVGADARIDPEGLMVRGRLAEGGRGQGITKNQTLAASASIRHQFEDSGELEFSVSDSRIDRRATRKDRFSDPLLHSIIYDAKDFDILKTSDRGSVDGAKIDASYISRSFVSSYDLVYSKSEDSFGYSFGASRVNEGYSQEIPTAVREKKVKDLGGAQGEGDRYLNAAFAEITYKPITELELNLAARFDDYSDFGSSTNPLFGIVYRPAPSLLFRGQAGTGFKAPSLRSVYDGEGRFYTSIRDYKKCEEAKASNVDADIKRYCNSDNSVETVSAGNKELEAEKSMNWGLGFAFEPVQGTGFTFDYWNSKIIDQIDNATAKDIMQMELEGRPLPKGISVVRAESTGGKLGDVIRLINPVTNLSELRASGIESQAYTSTKTSFGRFGLNSEYSYYLSYKYKPLPNSGYQEKIDENPRWRWNNTFLYSLGGVDYSLTNQQIGKHRKSVKAAGYVGSFSVWNANVVVSHPWNGSLTLGGQNILNKQYPFDETSGYDQGIDGQLYSLQGPSWYLAFDQKI